MRKTAMMFLSFFALATVAVFFSPKSANAYPGFARKYNFPCSFCHIQWPKLADTGHFFKDRGFMMSSSGKGNGLDMMFEKPGNQNYFPIGFHMSMAYYGSAVNGVQNSYSGANNGGWANGAYSNTVWDIESGGLINNWISFWVQPGAGSSPVSFGIVKLWVRFNDLLNSTWLNLYVGKTSIDPPFSNQRNVYIGTSVPWTMYDFEPGTPEVVTNGGASSAGISFANTVGLYTSGDRFAMANDVTSFRYFGYHINSPTSCMSQNSFSVKPCETRVSFSLIPNTGIYGGHFSGSGVAGNTPSTAGVASNGFNGFMHVTQSFGGWGRTNGERIGAFALIGAGAATPGTGTGTSSSSTVYNREGVDFMVNPIPNGGLNIFGAWEIAQDPTGMIQSNSALDPAGTVLGTGGATSGAEYMTWLLQADWQPTFGGFFAASGTNSNMISLIYNQLNMMHQPTFAGATSSIPGDYDNVTAFTLSDRYWLWGSDRADISLFAQYQFMINYGVSGVLNNISVAMGNGANYGNSYFGNVTANNFAAGIDFAY